MKKLRLHIYILLGFFLVTFIIGSFADQAINQALFSRDNGFGLTISAIGTIPGYGCFALLGGMLFISAKRSIDNKVIKILAMIFSFAAYGLGVYFSGREFFGENGFTNPSLYWLGFIIAAVILAGIAYLGYYLGKQSDNKNLWIIIVILFAAYFFSLIPGVTALKNIFHRPRYRLLATDEAQAAGLYFHSWWLPCKDYKSFMETLNVTKEEFKSFPSGHAGASMVFPLTAAFIPFVNRKYEKLQLPLLYGGFAWVLFVSFTRMLVGAHFLSDVSMGALLTTIFLLISNEVILHFKPAQKYMVEASFPQEEPELNTK